MKILRLRCKSLFFSFLCVTTCFLHAMQVPTTIHEAAGQGATVLVKKFIRENPLSVKKEDKSGRTPLHFVVHPDLQYKEIAELLCHHGAIVDKKDNWGFTPLGLFWNSKLNRNALREVGLVLQNGIVCKS